MGATLSKSIVGHGDHLALIYRNFKSNLLKAVATQQTPETDSE